jgi:hypothetical protein
MLTGVISQKKKDSQRKFKFGARVSDPKKKCKILEQKKPLEF